jgi:hypothetical protein
LIGWSYGYVSAVDSEGRTIWIADAHRDGKRFVVRGDEKLAAFLELELAAIVLDTQARFCPNLASLNGSESGGGLPPPRSVLRLFRTRIPILLQGQAKF